MEVSSQLHAPTVHWIGGWVDPAASLYAVAKLKKNPFTALRGIEPLHFIDVR
jgi:hypothetical protein